MKVFKIDELLKIENPTPGQPHRSEISLVADKFKNLGGMFGLLAPHTQVPYHYHNNRESIIIPLIGEAIEIIDNEETIIRPGDVLVIPSGEHHATVNRSDKEFRFLEFFTCPPMASDFVKVD